MLLLEVQLLPAVLQNFFDLRIKIFLSYKPEGMVLKALINQLVMIRHKNKQRLVIQAIEPVRNLHSGPVGNINIQKENITGPLCKSAHQRPARMKDLHRPFRQTASDCGRYHIQNLDFIITDID